MDLTHLHLILNHVPIVGLPVAFAFLVRGMITKNQSMEKFSLIMLAILGLFVLPIFFTGEPAEHTLKQMPDIGSTVKPFIHPHERFALYSTILTVITSVFSLFIVIFEKKISKIKRKLVLIVCALSCISILSLAYTGALGGQIRHTELR